MDRLVSRDIPGTTFTRVAALIMMIYALPRRVKRVDAIAVTPGQHETWRLVDAVRLWQASPQARYLLVAGDYLEDDTFFRPSLETLSQAPYNLTRTKGVIIQPFAHHTAEQADWFAEQVAELGITSAALVAPPFHMARAYLTFLKSLLQTGLMIPFIPMPVEISPSTIVPLQAKPAWELVAGEIERIIRYWADENIDDVATYEEAVAYLDWLWRQTFING